MQEQCPNCGNYWVGPAYPVSDGGLVAAMVICSLATVGVGFLLSRLILSPFFPSDPGLVLRVLVALLVACLVYTAFSFARSRRSIRADALAHFRRCNTCGFEWDSDATK